MSDVIIHLAGQIYQDQINSNKLDKIYELASLKVYNGYLTNISTYDVYQFNGWTFEWRRGRPFPPWPLKKNGEPRACAGNKFYSDISEWMNMSDSDQDTFQAIK